MWLTLPDPLLSLAVSVTLPFSLSHTHALSVYPSLCRLAWQISGWQLVGVLLHHPNCHVTLHFCLCPHDEHTASLAVAVERCLSFVWVAVRQAAECLTFLVASSQPDRSQTKVWRKHHCSGKIGVMWQNLRRGVANSKFCLQASLPMSRQIFQTHWQNQPMNNKQKNPRTPPHKQPTKTPTAPAPPPPLTPLCGVSCVPECGRNGNRQTAAQKPNNSSKSNRVCSPNTKQTSVSVCLSFCLCWFDFNFNLSVCFGSLL